MVTKRIDRPPLLYGRRYPWKSWFGAGRPVTLTRGTDFGGRAVSFGLTVRAAAKRHGVRVTVSVDPDGRWVRFAVVSRAAV